MLFVEHGEFLFKLHPKVFHLKKICTKTHKMSKKIEK